MKLFDFLFHKKPRVFAIADLHFASMVDKPMDVFGGQWENYEEAIEKDWKKTVRKNDIVIVAGDISWGMTLDEAMPDILKLASFGGEIVICRGNHDYWWKSVSTLREKFPKNIHIVQNDACSIGDYVFCGCRGWKAEERNKPQKEEDKKLLLREQERMKLALASAKKIKKNGQKLVVVMHYPPTNTKLDDSEFTKMFEEAGVDFVVFGHLHGRVRKTLVYTKGKTKYFLTSCDQVQNKLVLIK